MAAKNVSQIQNQRPAPVRERVLQYSFNQLISSCSSMIFIFDLSWSI